MASFHTKLLHVALWCFVGLAALYIGIYVAIIRPHTAPYSVFRTSPVINSKLMSVGYTLISPYNNSLNSDESNKGHVYLLDMLGYIVHEWTTDRQVLSAQLMPDGLLMATMETKAYSHPYPGGGNTGHLVVLDWNSRVVWSYENEAMHHEIALLPNGNRTVTLWEKPPARFNTLVRGGVPGTELAGTVWSDEIRELDPSGNTVWSWHAHEHLDPVRDVIDPQLIRAGWTYINGISYVPKNPIDGTEAYLVSMRTLDTVMLIRKMDGAVIWRSPKNLFNTQHDPNMLPNGNIVVFDNGFDRPPVPLTIYGSRVLEIDPRTDQVAWTFDGGPGVMDKLGFFGPLVGGAQPLPNGNLLITDGPRGHMFEVTKNHELVWDLVSPVTTKQTGFFPVRFMFKARRYSNAQVHFPDGLASAFDETSYRIASFLSPLYPRER